jgi:hypothetical protein
MTALSTSAATAISGNFQVSPEPSFSSPGVTLPSFLKTPHLTFFAISSLFVTASAYEEPRVFTAAEILPPYLLVGPNHRVREEAPADGYLIHFTIDSDFGVYECVGTAELERRIQEIRAMAILTEVSKSDLFAEGLKKSIGTPLGAFKNIVTDPGGAAKQVPKSVGHFFGKLGSGIGSAVRQAGDGKSKKDGTEEKNPAKEIGKTIRNVAGFNEAKLECAKQLGIDPYSDNARLQEEMDRVTWTFFAGGLPMKVALSTAASSVSRALSATEFVGLPEDLYELNESELKYRDRIALKEMGISQELSDTILANENLLPSLRHSMVNTLNSFHGQGRTKIVEEIAVCESTWSAWFLNDVLTLLQKQHEASPYRAFGVFRQLTAGLTPDGTVEVPAPVDYISWTPEVEELVTREDIAPVNRRLVLTGKISVEAANQFQAAGWEIVKVPR